MSATTVNSMARLEWPSAARKTSYLSLVEEIRAREERFIPFVLGFSTDDFAAFLQRLVDCANGAEVPSGFVAHQTFWLVDERDEVVAVSNLRLTLTPKLLRDGGHIGYGVRPSARRLGYATMILCETLREARRRGIERALVTCYKSNLGSAGAIRKNGGVLESEERFDGETDLKQRYWIETASAGSEKLPFNPVIS